MKFKRAEQAEEVDMLLQRGVRIGVLLALVQLGLSACSNGGTTVGDSSSSADGSGNSSSSVISSSASSSSQQSSASSSMSSVASSVSSSKSSSSSSMTSSSSRSSSSSSSSSSRSSSSSSSSNSSSSSSMSSGSLAIHVDGKNFKDASGNVIQLRGVNMMGMEYTAIDGFSPSNPYPQVVESTWAALHSWKVNIVRIPLNEDSYLGISCVTAYTGSGYTPPVAGQTQNADPGSNYQATLKQVVDRATAEGFYVILDLHLTAPNDPLNTVNNVTAQCATAQNPVPDADHAVAFWTGIATNYQSYHNVMFELFNEPFINQWGHFTGNEAAAWQALRDGVQMDSYVPLWATSYGHTWQSAGMQSMLNAIRGTGATNVVLESGLDYSATLDSWLTYKANDPLNQLAAVWHAYPAYGYAWGTTCYTFPGWCDNRSYTNADAILAANYPVIVTEFGDQSSTGTVGAPFASTLLPNLDTRGVSYLGWTFTATSGSDNILIKDNNGTPTDGYGVYVKAHYICRDAGTVNCP